MAAGLGFKTFNTGDVLSAADVNGYLMQGVLVFASAAARDAAITAPAEGQFAFTKDTNGLWYYDGAAWVASGATGDIEGVTAGTGISGGGTSGTVTITNSMATAIDAKGDLVVGTGADTFSRLAVGTNNHVLTADSTQATGLKWAAASGGTPTFVGCALTKSASQTISNNTGTFISFNGEDFDTDGFHDNTTNNTRITIPSGKAGKYQVNLNLQWAANTSGTRYCMLYKNGTVNYVEKLLSVSTTGGYAEQFLATIINLSEGDYIEAKVDQSSGGNLDVWGDNSLARGTSFSVSYLGA